MYIRLYIIFCLFRFRTAFYSFFFFIYTSNIYRAQQTGDFLVRPLCVVTIVLYYTHLQRVAGVRSGSPRGRRRIESCGKKIVKGV